MHCRLSPTPTASNQHPSSAGSNPGFIRIKQESIRMNKNLLGPLPYNKPSKSTLVRLKNILAIFEILLGETMSKSKLGGILKLSPSCIRKNIKILQEAGVVPAFVNSSFGKEAIYSIIRDDEEKLVEFAKQIKAHIQVTEDVLAGKTRWEDKQAVKVATGEMTKVTKTRINHCYEYMPGRRIYTTEGMTPTSMRAMRRDQMKIDPMRQAGLL